MGKTKVIQWLWLIWGQQKLIIDSDGAAADDGDKNPRSACSSWQQEAKPENHGTFIFLHLHGNISRVAISYLYGTDVQSESTLGLRDQLQVQHFLDMPTKCTKPSLHYKTDQNGFVSTYFQHLWPWLRNLRSDCVMWKRLCGLRGCAIFGFVDLVKAVLSLLYLWQSFRIARKIFL